MEKESDALYIHNFTFDEIQIGDSARISHALTEEDVEIFAIMSGDVNPAHVDPEYAKTDIFHAVVAHGMWGASLISCVLGTRLPGPGAIYVSQSLNFIRPVLLGDIITAIVTVTKKIPNKSRLELACQCINQDNKEVISGIACVLAPTEKITRKRVALPKLILQHSTF